MIEGFESVEAYARMNHIIDVCRGNLPRCRWEELPEEVRQSYLKEAQDAEYIITVDDTSDIERKLCD